MNTEPTTVMVGDEIGWGSPESTADWSVGKVVAVEGGMIKTDHIFDNGRHLYINIYDVVTVNGRRVRHPR